MIERYAQPEMSAVWSEQRKFDLWAEVEKLVVEAWVAEGVAPPEVELVDIYRGVVPFIILQLIGLIIIAIWPQLVIWLPAIAYG